MPTTSDPEETVECRNDVCLVGHVRRAPVERALPSGDPVVGFTVRIPRPERKAPGPRGVGDSIELGAWTPSLRRRALSLEVGDLIEVQGALRRQVRAAGGVPVSRYEVEVTRLKRLARASG